MENTTDTKLPAIPPLPAPTGSASTDKICIMCGKPFTPTFNVTTWRGTTVACVKCSSDLLDADERAEMAVLNGYRPKTYGDAKATHAICRHGCIVPSDADDHTCSWTLLVSNGQAQAQPPTAMPERKKDDR